MKDSELRTRAKELSLKIILACDEIDTRKGRSVLVNQIIRSATSIGANYNEAKLLNSELSETWGQIKSYFISSGAQNSKNVPIAFGILFLGTTLVSAVLLVVSIFI